MEMRQVIATLPKFMNYVHKNIPNTLKPRLSKQLFFLVSFDDILYS